MRVARPSAAVRPIAALALVAVLALALLLFFRPSQGGAAGPAAYIDRQESLSPLQPPLPMSGSWRQQTSGLTNWLWSVQWIDQQFARAGGSAGSFWGTTNAGLNWAVVPPAPPTSADIHDMTFLDRRNGWIVGDNYLGKTTDGGVTWQNQNFAANASGCYFYRLSIGWIVGGNAIHRTTDGGTTWQTVTLSDSLISLQDVHFVDQNVGWVVGSGGIILKSMNGGASWVFQSTPTGVMLEGLHFFDALRGFAVGHAGTILATADGGQTWSPVASGTSADLYSVEFVDESYGWAAGSGGMILITRDGGRTWTREDAGVGVSLQQVSALDTNHVVAAGGGGIILRRLLDLNVRAGRATNPPTLDGWVGEWDDVSSYFLNKSMAETVDREIPNSDDLQVTLKATWRPDYLYLAGPVKDDILIGNDGDPSLPWQSDEIEIGIETAVGTHQFTVAIDGRQADQGNLISGLGFYTKTVAGGWNYEIAIPASAVGLSEFKAGQTFGFTFGAWDDDVRGGTVGASHLIRRGTSTYARTSSVTGWGDLTLLSEDQVFPAATSTPTATPTATATSTPTATPTFTPSPTATPTATPPTTGLIRGQVWNDLDGDGEVGESEPGIFGVEVSLYLGGALRGVVRTDLNGEYVISGLTPGSYVVKHAPRKGLLLSTPGQVTVNVEAGKEAVVNFGQWVGRPTWLPLILNPIRE